MIDLHVHSKYSHDSEEQMENYITEDTKAFLTTEHADFEDPKYGYDNTFQLGKYLKNLKNMEVQFPNVKFYRGIEVGFSRRGFDKINKFIKDGEFEFIILSFHANEDVNYMSAPKDYDFCENMYLEDIIWGINNFEKVDVIGHLDYTFRRKDESSEFFTNPLLLEVFCLMKAKGIALEVNTSSMYNYGNYDFYIKLIEAYKNHGNKLIALGSDTHVAKHHMYKFEEVLPLLTDFEIINRRYDEL